MTTSPKSPDDDLRALAERATPGPWYAEDWQTDDGPNRTRVAAREPEQIAPGRSSIWPDGIQKISVADTECGENPEADAAFIAAANPQAILALLSRLETAERERDDTRRELTDVCGLGADLQDALHAQETRAETAEARCARLEEAVRGLTAIRAKSQAGVTITPVELDDAWSAGFTALAQSERTP
jgi:hypothetical protein